MPGFTKLFSTILGSTVWTESNETRIVWITMLAMADRDGNVYSSLPGLANFAHIDLRDTEKAVDKFFKPDAYSRTRDNEGRKIEAIDGGWHILNYEKYRSMLSPEEVRFRSKVRVARWRQKKKGDTKALPKKGNGVTRKTLQNVTGVTVTQCNDIAEAEAEAEKSVGSVSSIANQTSFQSKHKRAVALFDLPEWIDAELWKDFLAVRKHKKAVNSPRAFKLLVTELEKLRAQGENPNACIEQSIIESWKDVYPIKSKEGTRNGRQQRPDRRTQTGNWGRDRLPERDNETP